MMQFDLHVNPIIQARRSYPYVVSLQSDLMKTNMQQLVAPLIPRDALGAMTGRLTPIVAVNAVEHVVLVHALSPIRARDLASPIGSLAEARNALLSAIDYLFFGV